VATQNYYGRGKLLLTAEYAILDGALGLAVPTKFGQKMTIKSTTKSDLHWKALDPSGDVWFESTIALIDFSSVKTTDDEISKTLKKLLRGAVRLNSEFLSKWNGFNVITELEFPKNWGLGTSSTLTYLVAEWADVHPLLLYFEVFDGSGYDVACAAADGPITYKLDGDDISYTPIDYNPPFTKNLQFVHLNNKQSSAAGIKHYFKNVKKKKELSKGITAITEQIVKSKSCVDFIGLLKEHEALINKHVDLPMVQDQHFKDFNGVVKSLGAWGGDFVLAASKDNASDVKNYFNSKGYDTVLSYEEMVFQED